MKGQKIAEFYNQKPRLTLEEAVPGTKVRQIKYDDRGNPMARKAPGYIREVVNGDEVKVYWLDNKRVTGHSAWELILGRS